MIGSLKGVVFEVSDSLIKTFKDLQRSSKAKYETHNIIGRKPKLEFTGYELDDIQFNMQLNSSLGLDPVKQIDVLRGYKEKREVLTFILAKKVLGQFVVEEVNDTYTSIDNKGNIIKATVAIKLKEYN